MLLVMVVASIVRPLVGTAVLHHDHHALGAHTHTGPFLLVVDRASHCHGEAHSSEAHWAGDGGTVPCCDGEVAIVHLFREHGATARRASCLASWPWVARGRALMVGMCLVPPPAEIGVAGSPDRWSEGPRHLWALTAGGRLLATSHALLL